MTESDIRLEGPEVPREPVPAGGDKPIDPQKLLRIASLAREVLEEARKLSPDTTSAPNLAALYGRVQGKLSDALPSELFRELQEFELDIPFNDGATGDEVRVAYSGLIGWLGGLFQGLQASAQIQTLLQLDRGSDGEEGREGEGELPERKPEKPDKKEGYL